MSEMFIVYCVCFPLALWCPVIGQSQNESCVAARQRGACGRGQRSRRPVLGPSQLSGPGLRGQQHGKGPASSSSSSSPSPPPSPDFLPFSLLLLRSASTTVAPTSPPRPPSSPGAPTSNWSPKRRPCPWASLHPPSPNAPTPWSTSAGGSPPAGSAARSRSSPPTAWRTTPPRRSPER